MRTDYMALIVCSVGLSLSASADMRESAALHILTGKPISPFNCLEDRNGDGVADGSNCGIAIEIVRSITNRADVLALATKLDAENPVNIKAAAEAQAEAARQSPLRLAVATNLPALKVQAATIRDVATRDLLTKLLGYIEATETRLGATEAKEKAAK